MTGAPLACQPTLVQGQRAAPLVVPSLGMQRPVFQPFRAVEQVRAQRGAFPYQSGKHFMAGTPAQQRQADESSGDQQEGEPDQDGNGPLEQQRHQAENERGRNGGHDQARIEVVERVDVAYQPVQGLAAVLAGDLAR